MPSHRVQIKAEIKAEWDLNPETRNIPFDLDLANIEADLPKVHFFQRQGGQVGDTATKAYFELIPYTFEVFARNEEEIEEIVLVIEKTFDRAEFKIDGLGIIDMTRTAPTLVEQVGNQKWHAVASYAVRVNLSRR